MEVLPWKVASSPSSLWSDGAVSLSSSSFVTGYNVMCFRRCGKRRLLLHSGSRSWLLPLRRRFLPAGVSRENGPESFMARQFSREGSTVGKEFSDTEDFEDEDDDDDYDEAAEEYVIEESTEVSEEEYGLGAVVVAEDGVAVVDSVRAERFEVHKRQRVARLLGDVREFGEVIIDYHELAGIYDFPLDKFQQSAIQSFLDGSSIVVSVPTSSGKTLIAESAAVATVSRGRRLFYTTPLKALSNQKYREFREAFGENSVGLLTGDTAINKDAPIMIMTTEILRNMLYQSIGMISSGSRLFEVDVIVLDEVHYLSDISRGTVWEEIVIYCPKEVQLICLSATVANPDELAGWIGEIHGKTDLVSSSKRPVPLTWHFSLKNSLIPLVDAKGQKMNRKLSLSYLQHSSSQVEPYWDSSRRRNSRKERNEQINSGIGSISRQSTLSKNDINVLRRSQTPLIRDTLRQLQAKDMLPAIWFIFSRKGCDAAVQYVEDSNLLDESEQLKVKLALNTFKVKYPDAVKETAIKGLLNGVASHHAGCLPLWKSLIEELFQQGLVKVVFATETLAAGINMPARTAVIGSLSRRKENGRSFLSPNELHQMAGRAGRRGIDEEGHVVLIQTPYEGAEECFELHSASLEPLVSQFTASYGMVLNLLAGEKVTTVRMKESEVKSLSSGRTLDEARKLIEQSFGNYVGSNVMFSAKEEIKRIQQEMEYLSLESNDASIDRKCREQLSEMEYKEISQLQEDLRAEKKARAELRRKMELERMTGWRPVLESLDNSNLPFICLQYKDNEGVQQLVSAVYIGKVDTLPVSDTLNMVYLDQDFSDEAANANPGGYVALGSDNTWYLFTEKWIKTLYKTGFPNVSLSEGDALPLDSLKQLFVKEPMQWEKLSDSEFGPLYSMVGSLETWSWSLNVPVLSSLSEDNEIRPWTEAFQSAVESYREQKKKVTRLKKRITNTKGFKEFKKIVDQANFTKEKIERLNTRSKRLIKRIEQIEPSGWKEFLQISNVVQEARALDINSHIIYPLGETAAAIRGENELWFAMVLRNKLLSDLKPPQLAAVCSTLVSEGIKIRPWKNNCYIYEPSSVVIGVVQYLEEQRISLLQLQEKHGVQIPCMLDEQFSGMVEAWALGLTWREIMMDCALDDGDFARLLRRTIDLLAQIPKLPNIDPQLQKNAITASSVMDRVPISELVG